MFILWFILGMLVGTIISIFGMCLFYTAKDEEDK